MPENEIEKRYPERQKEARESVLLWKLRWKSGKERDIKKKGSDAP